jgi:hypothetical protein
MPCYSVIAVSTICENHPIGGGEPSNFLLFLSKTWPPHQLVMPSFST